MTRPNVIPINRRTVKYESVKGCSFLKYRTDTGVYYVRMYQAGHGRLTKSTGQKTLGRARAVAQEMINAWLKVSPKRSRSTVAEVCSVLMPVLEKEYKNGDRRFKTFDHDRTYLKVINDLFGSVFIDEIDEEYWDTWVRETGRNLNRTLFDVAKYLSKVLTFAYRNRLIDRKPMIRNPDQHKRIGRVLDEREIEELYKAASDDMKLQIVLAYECGMRTGEIRGLRWDFLEFDGEETICTLPAWFVKANARSIRLSENASHLLRLRRKAVDTELVFVFPSEKNESRCMTGVYQNRLWRRVTEAAGLGKVRFYDLRHTFYNRTLLELGLPVQLVSGYGGTSIKTLQKSYLQPSAERTKSVASAVQIKVKKD